MSTRVISKAFPLLLGSASPRRRELLQGLGIAHVVKPAQIVEDTLPAEDAERYVERIVLGKLAAVAQIALQQRFPHAAILVADTTVVVDGEILGKPLDVSDALRLLGKIAGRSHTVLTRYALSVAGSQAAPKCRTVRSEVTLRAAGADELWRYAQTGEGLDKAGAYAVQGIGSFLVRSINGSWSNVVGLPVCEVVEDLTDLGLLGPFPASP